MSGADSHDQSVAGRSLVAVPRALVPQPIRDGVGRKAASQPIFFVRKTGAQSTVSHRYRILGADETWIVLEHVRTVERWEARVYHGGRHGDEDRPALLDAASAWIDAKLGPTIAPALHERRWPLAAGAVALLGLAIMSLSPSGVREAVATVPVSGGIEISLGDAPMPAKKAPPPTPVVVQEQAKPAPVAAPEPRVPLPESGGPEADSAAGPAMLVPASGLEAVSAAYAAIVKAFASGVAVPWRGSGREGYVVVGPAQLIEGRACRNVVIWARSPAAGGETASLQKCMTKAGALVDL